MAYCKNTSITAGWLCHTAHPRPTAHRLYPCQIVVLTQINYLAAQPLPHFDCALAWQLVRLMLSISQQMTRLAPAIFAAIPTIPDPAPKSMTTLLRTICGCCKIYCANTCPDAHANTQYGQFFHRFSITAGVKSS